MSILITIGIVLLVIVTIYILMYNKLVQTKEKVANSKGQIAAQIESRWDALTNLIKATEKYEKHEAETLNNIVEKRASITGDSSIKDITQADNSFQSSLSRLIAISEAYPDLKASDVYKQTMNSVDKYENNVRLARMTYNDTVTMFNSMVKTIPTNIVAKSMGYNQEEYFEASNDKKQVPTWDWFWTRG